MIVLHLISSSGFFGAENVLTELTQAMTKTQTEFVPFVGVINNRYNPHVEICARLGASLVPCTVFECRTRIDVHLIFSLRSFIVKNNIAVVHAHGYKANFYAYCATRFLGTKLVATIHNWILTDTKLRVYAVFDKLLLKGFDAIAVVSRALENEVRAAGMPARKIYVINNGISTDHSVTEAHMKSARIELGIAASDTIIGTVGRLSHEKGHIYFVRAALKVLRDFPEVRFLVIGGGPLQDQLTAIVKESGHENRFIFAGLRSDVPVCLRMMDIFVLPSLIEGMPMALLEAMAAGRPIVATRVGAIPAVIGDTVDGLLVSPADADGLSESIVALLKDAPLARRLAESALRKVISEYSSQTMAGAYNKLYAAVVAEHPGEDS